MMNVFRVRLITILMAFGFIISACIGALLYYVLPVHYQFNPNWFFGIAIFVLALEVVLISCAEAASRKLSATKMVNFYMLTKLIKFLASIIFVTVYYFTVKDHLKGFVLTFMSFFLLYLFIETYLFSKIERHLKDKEP